MADHFVDNVNGNDGNSGHDMDNAWATIKYAVENGGALVAGDIVWIRRTVDESGDKTSDYTVVSDGTPASPIKLIGWPRNTASITGATWTNGSTTVDLVTGLTMDREKHQARYITAPNGDQYLITEITDSNTFIIDNEYSGSTVTLTNGASTIQADSDYTLAQAIDDSSWTIKVADWTGDADDLPIIGFGATDYNFYISLDDNWEIKNIEFKDTTDGYGILRIQSANTCYVEGCLFINNQSTGRVAQFNEVIVKRCTFEGDGTYAYHGGAFRSCHIFDCAFYNINGSHNISMTCYFENVNFNIEGVTTITFASLYINNAEGRPVCVNCKTGDDSLFRSGVTSSRTGRIIAVSENHQKVLGAHFIFTYFGDITKTDVVAGSGDPYKRTDGADSVLECEFDTALGDGKDSDYDIPVILEHEFEATTVSKTYRYYIQAEGAIASGKLILTAQYMDTYEDSTVYHMVTEKATGAISARSGASDWSQYLEITVQPAVASKVRIKLLCNYYHATNIFYVDPLAVIS